MCDVRTSLPERKGRGSAPLTPVGPRATAHADASSGLRFGSACEAQPRKTCELGGTTARPRVACRALRTRARSQLIAESSLAERAVPQRRAQQAHARATAPRPEAERAVAAYVPALRRAPLPAEEREPKGDLCSRLTKTPSWHAHATA